MTCLGHGPWPVEILSDSPHGAGPARASSTSRGQHEPEKGPPRGFPPSSTQLHALSSLPPWPETQTGQVQLREQRLPSVGHAAAGAGEGQSSW